MNTPQVTAEVFFTAFKSLKRHEREAVFERLLADEELSEDLADTLNLPARRDQPRQSLGKTLKKSNIRAQAGRSKSRVTQARNPPGSQRKFKSASPGPSSRWKKIPFRAAAKH